MSMTETIARPQITEPLEPQDFSKPVTIRWDPMGTQGVKRWWLCVGTVQKDVMDGDWNIISEDWRQETTVTIHVHNHEHNLEEIIGIRVQLLCTVEDDSTDTAESTMVLDPIVIESISAKA